MLVFVLTLKKNSQLKKKAAATKANPTTAEAAGKKAMKTFAKYGEPKADDVEKRTKKKGQGDEKEDLMARRRKLTMEDLAAAEQGLALVRCGKFQEFCSRSFLCFNFSLVLVVVFCFY